MSEMYFLLLQIIVKETSSNTEVQFLASTVANADTFIYVDVIDLRPNTEHIASVVTEGQAFDSAASAITVTTACKFIKLFSVPALQQT